MDAPAAKRRKASPPDETDDRISPLKKRPIRYSFASPTKASLARFNPGLLPARKTAESTPLKPRSRGNGIQRSVPLDDYLPSEDNEQEKLLAEAYDARNAEDTTGGADQPTETTQKPRLIERKYVPENEQAQVGAEQKDIPILLLEKKQEKQRLLSVIGELKDEVEHYARLVQKEQNRNRDETLDPDDLDELIDAINNADRTTDQQEEPEAQTLSHLLSAFLPFSRPVESPPEPQTTLEKPAFSHRPITLEDPLPYLEMFTSFKFSSSITLPGTTTKSSQYKGQTHTIRITGPGSLLTATMVMTIDTSNHQLVNLKIPALSSWAKRDLGKYINHRASLNEIAAVCWAFGSYWNISRRRAEFLNRCESEFNDLVSGRQQNGLENGKRGGGRPSKKSAPHGSRDDDDDDEVSGVMDGEERGNITALSRRELNHYLGRESLILESKEILFKVTWRIVFDWTGEAGSEVEAAAAVPKAWTDADEQDAFKKVPVIFDSLVRERGMFEATKIMVALLFGKK